jgi:glutamyl-tRNA(Gln) amidotransferase subunit E
LVALGVKEEQIKDEFVDITEIFSETECEVIHKAIKKGNRVLAVKLPKFKGFLKRELIPNVRLGTEMADRARFWGRVSGLFHTDELPSYGITMKEIQALKQNAGAKQNDAVVFVADVTENASDALKAVNKRAKEALKEVPQETRAAKPDGSTRYMRPRPGAARMYPETDIHPIKITEDYIEALKKNLPELPEKKMQRLTKGLGLNKKLAKQILDSEFSQLFEKVVKRIRISPTFVVVTLTETLKALRRDGVKVDKVSDEQLLSLFSLVGKGEIAKEASSDIIIWLSKHEESKAAEAVEALGLSLISKKVLAKIIDELIRENKKLLTENRKKAFGILMGLVMKKVRGKAEANYVSRIVKEKLNNSRKQ